MTPDVIIKVRFKTTEEGGRQKNIVIRNRFYGCPLYVDGEAFDCRVLVNDQTLDLGKAYELPVKFLRPDLALSKLSVGKSIMLWEMKTIAEGVVEQILK
jgi:hypothetical protein